MGTLMCLTLFHNLLKQRTFIKILNEGRTMNCTRKKLPSFLKATQGWHCSYSSQPLLPGFLDLKPISCTPCSHAIKLFSPLFASEFTVLCSSVPISY